MIVEANLAWRPALCIMDCLEAFVDGGPDQGTRAAPGVFLASDDRCALGLGAPPVAVEIIPADAAAREIAQRIAEQLRRG